MNEDFAKTLADFQEYERGVTADEFLCEASKSGKPQPWYPRDETSRRYFADWLLKQSITPFTYYAICLPKNKLRVLRNTLAKLPPAEQVQELNTKIEARRDLPPRYHQDSTFLRGPICLGRVQREFLFYLGRVAEAVQAQLTGAARNAGVKKGLDTLGALRGWAKKNHDKLNPSLLAEIEKQHYTLLLYERSPDHRQPALEYLVSRQLADGVGDRYFVPEGIFFWRELKHRLACVRDGQKQNLFTVALRRQHDTGQFDRAWSIIAEFLRSTLLHHLDAKMAALERDHWWFRIREIVPLLPDTANEQEKAGAAQNREDLWQLVLTLENDAEMRNLLFCLAFGKTDTLRKALRELLKYWQKLFKDGSGWRIDNILLGGAEQYEGEKQSNVASDVAKRAGVNLETLNLERDIPRRQERLGLRKSRSR